MTAAEQLKYDESHRFMERVVFDGFENLNSGYDSPLIIHVSPTDFNQVIDRCASLLVRIIGIEIFTTAGGFVSVETSPEEATLQEEYAWARGYVHAYHDVPDVSVCATFDVPDSLLNLNGLPPADRSVGEPDSREEEK